MADSQNLLADLTDAQRQAVTHVDGPLLIIAGAGSGKTRVITRRVAWLISLGIPPPSVLAITFTNKAAGEMKSRVSALGDRPLRDFGRLDQPWPIICTFHSLCLRILRHYAPRLGLPPAFSIYDTSDQSKLIKEAMKQLEISATHFAPAAVHAAIGNAKNQLLSPTQYAATARDFSQKVVARVYPKYQDLLKQNSTLDFDDLLLVAVAAFRDHPDVLAELQARFQYILVDEYQDTNRAQYMLAHALAAQHRNICVVGDPDQSIYGWRGADIQNILDFEKDYPDATIVKLEQNYRSTKTILQIASKLIARNKRRKEKDLWTENDQGPKARLFVCQDEHDEAAILVGQLKELREKGQFAWNQMAVFYRVNALSRVLEAALRSATIPYQIARGVEFYNRKEIKDTLAYLRLLVNANDQVSLERIVNVPARGLGDSALTQIAAHATSSGLTLYAAMQNAGAIPGLSTRAAHAAGSFVAMIESLRTDPLMDPPTGKCPAHVRQIMEKVLQASGLDAALRKQAKNDPEFDGLDNVNELISSAAEFDDNNPLGTLTDYLAGVSLVSDVDRLDGSGGAVTLMTLHAAKGLEFDVVAIAGLEEGILPHSRARESRDDLEEERRLCFVGITRARKHLLLSKAAVRTVRGIRMPTIDSPFLSELPSDALEVFDRTGTPDDQRGLERRFVPDADFDRGGGVMFRRGQLVRHPIFGLGRIAEISGSAANTRAAIDFNTAGRKTLILQFAKLEPVG